jgi:hypothetical protein
MKANTGANRNYRQAPTAQEAEEQRRKNKHRRDELHASEKA